ncbi:MAG: flagellar hook-associated protein FlgL [Thermodesulfobacteriota bacterium]
MRVSNKAVYDTVTQNLARTSDAMFRANQVVSTGKKINRLSDDPVGLVSVLGLRSSLEYIGQLERNITMGNSWLNMGETALTKVEDILSQAKALTIQMSSANVGEKERANSAEIAEGFLQQVLSLANTMVDGRYIFAGTNTDTAPFELETVNEDPDYRMVDYNGNGTEFSIEIAKDIHVGVGRDGESIFGSDDFAWGDPNTGQNNIFKTLIDLKTALENNDVPSIQTTMGELDSQMDRIRGLIADTGSKLNRLDLKANIIQDLRLTYTDRKSELEDADITEAMMDLAAKELAYQAALNSSAKMMQMSLVDFI